jgi:hypothetical protein
LSLNLIIGTATRNRSPLATAVTASRPPQQQQQQQQQQRAEQQPAFMQGLQQRHITTDARIIHPNSENSPKTEAGMKPQTPHILRSCMRNTAVFDWCCQEDNSG